MYTTSMLERHPSCPAQEAVAQGRCAARHTQAAQSQRSRVGHWSRRDLPMCAGRDGQSVRSFATFTPDLNALADWLQACAIDTVVMESTGVCWRPIYEVLESRVFAVHLVNDRQLNNVSGRKADVLDCQLIEQLHILRLPLRCTQGHVSGQAPWPVECLLSSHRTDVCTSRLGPASPRPHPLSLSPPLAHAENPRTHECQTDLCHR